LTGAPSNLDTRIDQAREFLARADLDTIQTAVAMCCYAWRNPGPKLDKLASTCNSTYSQR